MVDPGKHGTVFASRYFEAPKPRKQPDGTWKSVGGIDKMFAIGAEWQGNDFIVTVPDLLPKWRDWPTYGQEKTRFVRYWRRSTYNHCAKALSEFSGIEGLRFERTTGRILGLFERLDSFGIVRISPGTLDPDSMVHWPHHMRDGVHDLWCGYTVNKNGDARWQGSQRDKEADPLYKHCGYHQLQEGDAYGHQIVFRFSKVQIV